MKYDLIVIGNTDEAVQAAIAAARQGKTVALASEPGQAIGGSSAKGLRQAMTRSNGMEIVSMASLRQAVLQASESHQADGIEKLDHFGVDRFCGEIRFVDANTVAVRGEHLTGTEIVLACGIRSARLGNACVNGKTILNAEQVLDLEELPESMIVIGAGRTGLDHAVALSRLGVDVVVVDEHSNVFDLCGGLMDGNLFEAQDLGIGFRLGDEAIGIEEKAGNQIAVRLASGRTLTANAALICVGHEGRTDGLNLEQAGVGVDERGRVWCDAEGRTWAPHITAIGDVVGFRSAAMAG